MKRVLVAALLVSFTASASGSGSTAEQQIFFEGTISNQNSTITNDTSGCVAPPSPAPTPIPVSPNFTG